MSRGAAKVAAGSAEIEAEIAEVRERIATLADQIEDLQSAPASVGDALARLDAITQNIGVDGEPAVGYFFASEAGPSAHTLGIAGGKDSPDGVAFLYWLLRDLIRERLADEIQKRGADLGSSISRSDRDQRIAKLQLSLRSAEVEEENIIRSAEAQGMRPMRRPDADPSIILS